jgi:hypothetical protein
MARGLDEQGREHIRRLINGGASGDAVRKAIAVRVRSTDWDYRKNLELLDWMRRRSWNETAEYLARYLEER